MENELAEFEKLEIVPNFGYEVDQEIATELGAFEENAIDLYDIQSELV
ncbi:TPA: hypothetical protein RPW02_001736 [Campylobacter fetus subsp. venerealis]|uniref:Uncharacterized protein n=1 Tax=Campylobacter fetus TaxID=196 RepID=A0A7D7L132_CAMFE|nr:hypothetical protein [Campylobacter fetus]QMS63968.1 hypothetical protein GZ987_010255 [Campylobacter fetus]QMS67727.1 hypothetical protein GZ985_009025 [Campylobacter fetus]QMS69502.1 hypothetical protein GZ984_009460 [Campylobacter fetus]QMS69530.1 hypothetical protein GZ984_009275 [Campylobacter fetus]WKW23903.1 hypothetical protein IXZ22_11195 [Campylobacter fetus subsp. venerealis]